MTPIEKLAAFHVARNGPEDCYDYNYQSNFIDYLKNETLDTSDINRQWTCQTCAEFGFGQSAASSKSIFGVFQYLNEQVVHEEMCKQVFGITDTNDRVDATNKRYGGLAIDVADVIFPNGNIDPWSSLSLINGTKVFNPSSKIAYIDGTSHCRDMYNIGNSDSSSVVWAHEEIEKHVDNILRKKC
jgi:hypothetical protein